MKTSAPRLLPRLAWLPAMLVLGLPMGAGAQTLVPDGPVGPWSYLSNSNQWNPNGRSFALHWALDPAAFPVLDDGAAEPVPTQPSDHYYQFLASVDPVPVLGSADLVDPIDMTENPWTGEIWITDFGGNKILSYDPVTDDLRTLVDGNQGGVTLDGPWGIEFVRGRYGSFNAAVVTSHNNSTLYQVNIDGSVRAIYNDGGRSTYPSAVGGNWSFDALTQTWQPGTTVMIGFHGQDSVRGHDGCTTFSCMFIGAIAVGDIVRDPIAIAGSPSGQHTGFILTAAGTVVASHGGFPFPSRQPSEIMGGSNAVPGAMGLSLMSIEATALNFHPKDSLAIARLPSAGLFISDTPRNRILRLPLTGGTPTEVLQIDSPVGVLRHSVSGDIFVLQSNPSTGEAGLGRIPAVASAQVTASSAAADHVLGVSDAEFPLHNSWAMSGGQLSTPVRFGAPLDVHSGWLDDDSAVALDITVTASPDLPVPQPAVAVTSPAPGVLEATIRHEVGAFGDDADQIAVYQLSGCQTAVNATQAHGPCPDNWFLQELVCLRDWEPTLPNRGRPLTMNMGDIDDCLRLVGVYDAAGGDETVLTLDDVPWVHDVTYCLAAQSIDTDANQISVASDIDSVDACERVQTGTRTGIFCNQALTAESYDPATGFPHMPTATAGTPTWYEYRVEGAIGEPRRLVAWVNDDEAEGSLVSVFRQCPGGGDRPDEEGRHQVSFLAEGGELLRIRIAHFEELPGTWRLLDLSAEPTAELTAPENLTATADQDGQITVCWDAVEALDALAIDPDHLAYDIYRGPVGSGATELLEEAWRADCYRDLHLPASGAFEYRVVTRYGLRVVTDQTLVTELFGPSSATTEGSTSSNDVSGSGFAVAAPGNLVVQLPHVPDGTTNVGTQMWWDADLQAARHRVVQTDLATLQSESFVVTGGVRAADVPATELSRYCYDVYAQRQDASGSWVESSGAGYTALGDTSYCVNVCQDGTQTVDLQVVSQAEVSFTGPVRFFQVELGDQAGQLFVSNDTGLPARISLQQGGSDCENHTALGTFEPDQFGNTAANVFVSDLTDPVYVKVEYLPGTPLSPRQMKTINFPVSFGRGVANTGDNPQVAMTVVGTECATQVSIDYLINSWTPGIDGFVNFIADGRSIATTDVLTDVLDLPVDPAFGLHEITIQLFNNPLELLFSRRTLVPATRMLGDVNFDCTINVLDVVIVNNHILGIDPFPETMWEVGDLSNDSVVDVLDIVALVTSIITDSEG